MSSRPAAREITTAKKLVFSLVVAILVCVCLELALWLAGVVPGDLRADPYAGFAPGTSHFVKDVGGDGQAWLVVAPSKANVLNPQRFRVAKPAGTYRIVCVGGSSTYGRPFFDQTSYAGWLRELLPLADASRNWEVINAGAISYASYRVANVMQELSAYEPDLFVVDVGHNEFLERRTYSRLAETPPLLTEAMALVTRTRTATVMRNILEAAGVPRRARGHRAPLLGENVKAVPINAVGPEAYHRDPRFAQNVVTHFRATLERMVGIARDAGAEILFVVPASNLADFAPFKSEHRDGLGLQETAECDRQYARAKLLFGNGQLDAALGEIKAAEEVDPHHAGILYLEGRILQSLGRYAEAKASFVRARDEDLCPLRAITPIVEAVSVVANRYGVPTADFQRLVEQSSDGGLPGRTMFHDHVHATIEANRQLAMTMIEVLQEHGIVHAGKSWNDASIAEVADRVESRVDRPRHAGELQKLAAMMAWLDQPEQARFQAEQSLALSGRTPDALLSLADLIRRQNSWDLASTYYRELQGIAPNSAEAHSGLGLCLVESGNEDEGMLQLGEAVRLKPGLVDAHRRLGQALLRRGQFAEAERNLIEAIRLGADDAGACADLGETLSGQGRSRDAVAYFQRALALDPNSARTHYALAMALEDLGQSREASLHYEAALSLKPGHEDARVRLRRLVAAGRH